MTLMIIILTIARVGHRREGRSASTQVNFDRMNALCVVATRMEHNLVLLVHADRTSTSSHRRNRRVTTFTSTTAPNKTAADGPCWMYEWYVGIVRHLMKEFHTADVDGRVDVYSQTFNLVLSHVYGDDEEKKARNFLVK